MASRKGKTRPPPAADAVEPLADAQSFDAEAEAHPDAIVDRPVLPSTDLAAKRPRAPRDTVWGHAFVALSACVLTVSILGSIVFLCFRAYERYSYRLRVRTFIETLDTRTDAEIDDLAGQLRTKDKLAIYVLPEVLKSIHDARSERQLVASLRVAKAFLHKSGIREALFAMRNDNREVVASAAVEALSHVEPPSEAAGLLAKCLDSATDAVVDEASSGLLRLGAAGRAAAATRIEQLPVDRRIWLAGFIRAEAPPDQTEWLELLQTDPDERVRRAAESLPPATGPVPQTG